MTDESPDTRRVEDDLPVSHVAEPPTCEPLLTHEISERLSHAEQSGFFCALVDSALDAIIAHHADGRILYANRGAAELLGYTAEQLIELPPYGWVASDEMAAAPRRIESILHDGRLTFASRARRADGSTLPTEVRSRRVDTSFGPVIVAVIRDVTERVETQRTLEHLAYHDPLTGLGNRASLDERLAVAIADAKRHGDLLGIAYIDLDEFKPVNDRHGHAVGDEVLVEVGHRLRKELREQDAIARMGGDEFVVLLPRLASREELPAVAERLIHSIEDPILASGESLNIKASIGLAYFDVATDDARSLIVKADIAMYSAKLDAAHPWLVYREGMTLPNRRER